MAATPLNLKVGERMFTTTRDTLSKSGFFSALISGPWEGDLLMDGSYFVDADPDTFEHVLKYLRHGTFPLFTTTQKVTIIGKARYFQIPSLEKWIRDKAYLKVVKSVHKAYELEAIEDISRSHSSEVDVKYYPTWKKEQTYICPRNIFIHRGNPRACGKQCKQAQGDAEPEYVEELILKTLVIQEEKSFDFTVCSSDDR
ncbi:hypothetical protein G7Y79_00065g094510 [Physcia stellaris]|nr:hypothetical protein G7Y79_00065g094510 [Physcia stellaris]